jgi:hypothetical protein
MDKCKVCHGNGHVTFAMKDRSGKTYGGFPILGIDVCPICLGKGYTTPEDSKRVISVEMLNQIVD